jgi:predicted SprT family Zn-dependent metalloprotease
MKPTIQQAQAFQGLWEYFNRELFGEELSGEVLLNFSRKGKVLGFFAPDRWEGRDGQGSIHEISLNPDYLKRDFKAVMGTLVHEMCHQWQHENGTAARKGFHNKEWGRKMKDVGLFPSSTGQEGGKETGDKVSHYVVEGGKFEEKYGVMREELKLPFIAVDSTIQKVKKVAKKSKFRYACGECGLRVWAKEGVKVTCGECGVELKMEGEDK